MSALFDELHRLHRAGHEVDIDDLLDDGGLGPDGTSRDAAVLIAITDRPRPGMLLTQRPDTMADHPGQVAFPGGKIEAGENAVEAALREAEEELGIARDAVRVIGPTDLFNTGSGFAVTPVLAVVPHDISITPDPGEVADWFEPPLDFVIDPANRSAHEAFWKGQNRHYYQINWEGYRIWGITAAIIANLSRRVDWKGLING